LRRSGQLQRREVVLPGGRFAVGDRVVVRRNDRQSGLSNGDRGVVLAIDPRLRRLELECGERCVVLGAEFLLGQTEHGDPTLSHGYAVTVHVARGATVDRAYVLGHGLSRESGYTAMSRGRDANHLYVADAVPDREEFAPAEPGRRTAVERLVSDLQRCTAESLAIDARERTPAARRRERRTTRLARERSIDHDFGIDR
jgi:ATP-dependent exoDNAse (exonuclease V) alpha subunit